MRSRNQQSLSTGLRPWLLADAPIGADSAGASRSRGSGEWPRLAPPSLTRYTRHAAGPGSGSTIFGVGEVMMTSSVWFYLALLSAVFAALTAIFAKIGIRDVDSDLATLIRTAFIIVLLAGFVWFTGKWSNPLTLPARTWIFLGLSGLCAGASWVCYFRALQLGDASKVAPVDKLSLVLVAIFAVAFLGERPSLRDWSAIALVAGGVLLLALKR